MNKKTIALAMMLTINLAVNGLCGIMICEGRTPRTPLEPWKCGDRVREIPTILIGNLCWMNANIGYSEHNHGAYYSWQEALTVCDSVFGDGWRLPSSDMPLYNTTITGWNVQAARYKNAAGVIQTNQLEKRTKNEQPYIGHLSAGVTWTTSRNADKVHVIGSGPLCGCTHHYSYAYMYFPSHPENPHKGIICWSSEHGTIASGFSTHFGSAVVLHSIPLNSKAAIRCVKTP